MSRRKGKILELLNGQSKGRVWAHPVDRVRLTGRARQKLQRDWWEGEIKKGVSK